MDLAELGRVGRASMVVALIGVAVPFALGSAVGLGFGESGNTALFLGAALTATSVGITARVFGDLRALATTEARVVLGAAVADDVLGLIILTVVVKVVTGGDVDRTLDRRPPSVVPSASSSSPPVVGVARRPVRVPLRSNSGRGRRRRSSWSPWRSSWRSRGRPRGPTWRRSSAPSSPAWRSGAATSTLASSASSEPSPTC